MNPDLDKLKAVKEMIDVIIAVRQPTIVVLRVVAATNWCSAVLQLTVV